MSWPTGHPVAPPVRRSRLSMRVRLIGLVVLVTLIALAVLDLVLPRIVRGALVDSLDQSLTTTIYSLQDPSPQTLAAVSANSPLKSGIGWTVVRASGISQVIQSSTIDTGAPDLAGRRCRRPGHCRDTRTAPALPDAWPGWSPAPTDGRPARLVVWTNLSDIDDVIAKFALRRDPAHRRSAGRCSAASRHC